MYIKTYSSTEKCNVELSKSLAVKCKPEKGDPIGATTEFHMADASNRDLIEAILLDSGQDILRAKGEQFICIPAIRYEQLLKLLSA